MIANKASEYNQLTTDQKIDIHELYALPFSFSECVDAYIKNDCDKNKAEVYLLSTRK